MRNAATATSPDTARGRHAGGRGSLSPVSPFELPDGLRRQRGRLEVRGVARAAVTAACQRRAMDAQQSEVRALEAEIAALRRACEEPRTAGEDNWRAQYVPAGPGDGGRAPPAAHPPPSPGRRGLRCPRPTPPQPSVGPVKENGGLGSVSFAGSRAGGGAASWRASLRAPEGAAGPESGAPFEK